MAKLQFLVCVCLLAAAQSASVHRRDIPVKVVYDGEVRHLAGVRNLQEKPQVVEKVQTGIRNLEEKPQLSQEQLSEAAVKIVTPDQQQPQVELVTGIPNINLYPEQNIDDIYEKIQEIIHNGAKKIRTALEVDNKAKPETLQSLNSTLENFLDDTKKTLGLKKLALKQEQPAQNQNPLQVIMSNLQTAAGTFISGLTGGAQGGAPGSQSDEQPTNPIQNLFSQIQSSIQQLLPGGAPAASSGTVLGDATPAPPNFVQNAVQQLQQSVSNFFQGPGAASGSQSDETTQSNNPLQFLQNAFQNLNPFQQNTAKPVTQNDPVTPAPANPVQGIIGAFNPQTGIQQGQNIATQIGSAIGSGGAGANPIQQGQTIATQIASGGNNPIQQGQAIATQIGSAINQQPAAGGAGASPIEQGQNIAGQISSAINPGAAGAGNNPIQAGQDIATQIGSAINPQAVQQGQGIATQLQQAAGGNSPIQQGQDLATQIGTALNPAGGGASSPIQQGQTIATQIGSALGQAPGKPAYKDAGLVKEEASNEIVAPVAVVEEKKEEPAKTIA